MTAMYVAMGFIYTLIGIPMIAFGNPGLKGMGFFYLFMPIIMGIFGFVFFVIVAAVYNFLANQFGGVEVEVRDVDQAT